PLSQSLAHTLSLPLSLSLSHTLPPSLSLSLSLSHIFSLSLTHCISLSLSHSLPLSLTHTHTHTHTHIYILATQESSISTMTRLSGVQISHDLEHSNESHDLSRLARATMLLLIKILSSALPSLGGHTHTHTDTTHTQEYINTNTDHHTHTHTHWHIAQTKRAMKQLSCHTVGSCK